MTPASVAQRYAVRTTMGVLLGRYHDKGTAERYAGDANRSAAEMGLLATTYKVHDLGDPIANGRYVDPESQP